MADGTPVLSDFGLAKVVGMQVGITNLGTVLGSAEHISPEQAMRQMLDRRTELYSLGVMFYAMLIGLPPYRGRTQLKTMWMHLEQPVLTLPAAH